MKSSRFFIVLLLLTFIVFPLCAQSNSEEVPLIEEKDVETLNTPIVPTFCDIDKSDMISAFNYAYASMIIESYKGQNISMNASYWLRGLYDGNQIGEIDALMTVDEMNNAINEYIESFYNAGLTKDCGDVMSLDEIKALDKPSDIVDTFSYAYAYMTIFQLKYYNGLDISILPFMQGTVEAFFLDEPRSMTTDEMNSAIENYSKHLEEEYTAYYEELKTNNLADAEAFMASLEEVEGVTKVEDGLYIEVIQEDEILGEKPQSGDSVTLDYTLQILDGTILDQGTDAVFPLGQNSLIKGFEDAVLSMHVGQSICAYIHPTLGYGENGNNAVEPNSLLIFTIYLKGIVRE